MVPFKLEYRLCILPSENQGIIRGRILCFKVAAMKLWLRGNEGSRAEEGRIFKEMMTLSKHPWGFHDG
jgi:hypothetical protein